jgi:hypothetical protein
MAPQREIETQPERKTEVSRAGQLENAEFPPSILPSPTIIMPCLLRLSDKPYLLFELLFWRDSRKYGTICHQSHPNRVLENQRVSDSGNRFYHQSEPLLLETRLMVCDTAIQCTGSGGDQTLAHFPDQTIQKVTRNGRLSLFTAPRADLVFLLRSNPTA